MRVLVAGGDGFIGRNVSAVLQSQGHEVFRSARDAGEGVVGINLLDKKEASQNVVSIQPDIIINCAGVVGNGDFDDNVRISRNLLLAVGEAGLQLHRYIMCGSAGEYGNVPQSSWPVREDAPLQATSPYALSKIEEERTVRELGEKYDIDVIIARIFNPLGVGMSPRFLTSNILDQIQKVKLGETDTITVGRADALRDYIHIGDVAKAIALIATKDHTHDVYNIGSGVASTTEELVRLMLDESGVEAIIKESSNEPEASVASQADISRIQGEFSWQPTRSLGWIVKEIVHGTADK